MAFSSYIKQFQKALSEKNGDQLNLFLSYQNELSSYDSLLMDFDEQYISKFISFPWNEICIYHLKCCLNLSNSKFILAYKEQANLIQSFTKALNSMSNENWMLPVLNILIKELRFLAIAADLEVSLMKNDINQVLKPHVHLEKAADLLMGLFRITATDTRGSLETSKRKSMMHIINQLFKIYFKINKLHLCKPLTRALETAKINHCFKMPELVTYNYFLGIKHMFDSDYRTADNLLSFSFNNCYTNSFKNRRLILIFLIPIKMLIGLMPTTKLLRDYDLMHFEDVVKAIKQGNIRKLDQALENKSEFFWKFGIYLILEKLKMNAYRNVFKKVMLISGTHQIPITHFQAAVNFLQDTQITIEEIHCILANLISDGKIRGYISLQHQKLVVSKQNPFPNLALIS